jgi:osmotically-inducible protein OsmY
MRCSILVAVAAMVFAWAGIAEAQFGNTGGMTRSNSTSGRSTSNSSAFGSTNRGGSIGNANRSFSGNSQGRLGGLDAAGSNAGQLTGNERFTRQGRQAGSFVGRDQQDMQGFVGALNAISGRNGQMNNQSNQYRNMNGQNRNGRNGQQGEDFFDNQAVDQMANQRRFRTKVTLGFKPAPQPASVIATGLTSRLTRILGQSVGSGVQVELADGTAILSGTVPTSQEKLLAESLAMLEPGIAQVQNDLVVAESTSSDATNSQ